MHDHRKRQHCLKANIDDVSGRSARPRRSGTDRAGGGAAPQGGTAGLRLEPGAGGKADCWSLAEAAAHGSPYRVQASYVATGNYWPPADRRASRHLVSGHQHNAPQLATPSGEVPDGA
jgi:hypothetical protein